MAGVTMRSTDFRAVVEPIFNKVFDGRYDLRKDEWKAVFTEEQGDAAAYHEEVMLYGFNAAPEIPDGNPISYDSGGQQYIMRWDYKQYGLAFAITQVLMEDGKAVSFGSTFSKHLADSMVETKEWLTANVLNRAFNSAYKGGDDKELCATDHPIVGGLTFSNEAGTPSALSQTSLEQMIVQIRGAVDGRGKKIALQPDRLIIEPTNMFVAETILKSVGRTGTANNDINPLKSMGVINGVSEITRLTSTTAWFVTTKGHKGGMRVFRRRALTKGMEGDFDTNNMRWKAHERYGVGLPLDSRCIYGNAGA